MRLPRVHWVGFWVGLAALGWSCVDDPGPTVTTRGAALSGDRVGRTGSLRTPLRLNPSGPYLVSPRPSPDGHWVAAAGRGGVGVYVVSAEGSGPVRRVDSSYRGPRAWSASPVALHFGHLSPVAWLPRSGRTEAGRAIWQSEWDETLGRFLARGAAGSVYHHPRLGTVTLVRRDGSTEVRGQGRAWGARVSPDAARVAWCTGTLGQPRLFVWTFGSDRIQALGAGAQPAWSPDSVRLLFVRPLALRRFGGHTTVERSELRLWSGGAGAPVRLATRIGHAPMEPTFGPDGQTIYYVDWRDGGLFRASLGRAGGVP